jgi:uncharacterized protein YndB with AHSA1/START domain
MKNRSAVHSTFTIERSYPVAPARVFAAWSSQEAKARWFVGPDEWKKSDHVLDFRVGGRGFHRWLRRFEQPRNGHHSAPRATGSFAP